MNHKVTPRKREQEPTQRTIHTTYRITARLNDAMNRYILDSRPRKLTKADVIESALQALLYPQDAYWEMVLKRMDRERTALERLSSRVEVMYEMFNLFLRYYFIQWPDLKPEEKEDLHSRGRRAYVIFRRMLDRSIKEKGFLASLLEKDENLSEDRPDENTNIREGTGK